MPQFFRRHKSSNRCVLFSFHKLDAITGNEIPGAKFQLKSCFKKCAIQNEISNFAGLVRFKLKPCRVYTLQEVVTPVGYMPNQHVYIVMADSRGCIFVDGVYVSNFNALNIPVRGTFSITKTDAATTRPLTGAVFSLSQNSVQIATSTSGINGILSFSNLIPGRYTLREITPPIGYVEIPNVFSVTVNQDGSVTIDGSPSTGFSIGNTIQTFAFNILNVNSITNNSVSGAVFGLFLDDNQIAESVSDVNGNLIFTSLTPGTYTLRQLAPAYGYSPNTDIFTVVVDNDGSVTINAEPAEGFIIRNVPILPQSPQPTINSVSELNTMVSGSGESGCQITVTFLQTSATVSTTVDASGAWVVLVPESSQPLLDGQLISAVQTCADVLPSEPVIIAVTPSSIDTFSSGNNSCINGRRYIRNVSSNGNYFIGRV